MRKGQKQKVASGAKAKPAAKVRSKPAAKDDDSIASSLKSGSSRTRSRTKRRVTKRPIPRDDLVKVVVRIPNHWFLPAESMWARPVGRGKCQLKNIPFFAYDLNFDDVVRTQPAEDSLPEVVAVIERSGNQTLRVIFESDVAGKKRLAALAALRPLSVRYEGCDERYFALNVADPNRYAEVERALVPLRDQGVLDYETCEARVAGSFDDAPPKHRR